MPEDVLGQKKSLEPHNNDDGAIFRWQCWSGLVHLAFRATQAPLVLHNSGEVYH